MKKLLAVDPGASGGFAWRTSENMVTCVKMPDTDRDIVDLIASILSNNSEPYEAWVEEVGGFCGVGQPGSSMFKFGKGYGFILGVLATRGVRVELVKPQKWQKFFGLGTVKLSGGKTPWKNKLKQKAQQLFPECDVTLSTSDALLILEYGTRTAL